MTRMPSDYSREFTELEIVVLRLNVYDYLTMVESPMSLFCSMDDRRWGMINTYTWSVVISHFVILEILMNFGFASADHVCAFSILLAASEADFPRDINTYVLLDIGGIFVTRRGHKRSIVVLFVISTLYVVLDIVSKMHVNRVLFTIQSHSELQKSVSQESIARDPHPAQHILLCLWIVQGMVSASSLLKIYVDGTSQGIVW
ncbi:hypothetical protein EV702DRAFT_1044036 [Suillus placidus]|uniref:Uncharacterized protein n=1 Tax=Suillus placidus TaxID=48579 RepID=A0A9P6ZYI3_9AGAM|nr:hypothetical protein EV702DRAFT_1044036 [Suillus placidus]